MMKHFLFFLYCFCFLQQINAQYTQVPDPNFEQALIDLGIDSEGILDGQFLTVDAENIAYLYVDNRNISDLTGIEAFVNLQWLDAFSNNISSLDLNLITSPVLSTLILGNNNLVTIDLSPLQYIINLNLQGNNIQNLVVANHNNLFGLGVRNQTITDLTITNCPNLQLLDFDNTSIQNIDLSGAPFLKEVLCEESLIQSLDFTNNPNLEEVYASNSSLSSINLPNNPNLEILDVDACQLTELDITNCPSLIDLECYGNILTDLDFSNNTLLEDVQCSNNQLTTLDLSNNPNIFRFWAINNLLEGDLDFYGNPALEDLWLDNNFFNSLDLSQNTILEKAWLQNNPNVEMVNINNGNNEIITGLVVLNCPNLSCIVVDNPLADNNFIVVEQNANINIVGSPEECNLSISENDLQQIINVYPNPAKEKLFIENYENIKIEKITIYDVLGKVVLVQKNSFNNLNLSSLNSGILFIKIETENGTITKKIIKE